MLSRELSENLHIGQGLGQRSRSLLHMDVDGLNMEVHGDLIAKFARGEVGTRNDNQLLARSHGVTFWV
jgi:hypothetical protein